VRTLSKGNLVDIASLALINYQQLETLANAGKPPPEFGPLEFTFELAASKRLQKKLEVIRHNEAYEKRRQEGEITRAMWGRQV
jgi:hypothetical protein